jgi:FkbM family methyltransferase
MTNEMSAYAPSDIEAILGRDLSSTLRWERQAFDQLVAPFGRSLILFGAGNLGRQILARLLVEGIEPKAFTDNNRALHGTLIEGVPVLSPEDAATKYGRSAAFVVTIWNPEHSFLQTRQQLTALGCTRVVSAIPLRWKFAEDLLPFFWLDLPSRTLDDAASVKSALSIWADEFSRKEFLAQLRFRLYGEFDSLSAPVPQASYFPDDLFALRPEEVFIDCGAFDGITIRQFLEHRSSFKGQIVAFEPDPHNHKSLLAYASGLPAHLRARIVVSSQAVGSTGGTLKFNATGTMGSAVDVHGTVDVEGVALDAYLTKASLVPSYIKMDIEGAELEALAGARGTIKQHKPVLAVCLYHRPTDLWRIPLFVRSLTDQYSLFLRPHETEGWQLVCYAIPTSRLRTRPARFEA